MGLVTAVPAIRTALFERLLTEFDLPIQVTYGQPLAEPWQSDQIVAVGASQPADVDVDWAALGNYAREEQFNQEIQVGLWLRDQPDPVAADRYLMDVVSRIYRQVNVPTMDLGIGGDLQALGCPKLTVVVTGADPRTVPHPDGGHECTAAVRVSVAARVNAR